MRLKFFVAHLAFMCLTQFAVVLTTQAEDNVEQKTSFLDSSDVNGMRSKRQNGYGNGNEMWNNGNFPMGGNWNGNGPNSNGYGGSGPQGPAPEDSIKGSVGTAQEKKPEEYQTQRPEQGQGPWWPNGAQNGYNNGPYPNGYNGHGHNHGYNNGPMPFNGGSTNGNGNVDDGIKGSVGAAPEPTQAPFTNSYGFGSRPGYNGYGNQGNQGFGFNRMVGYGNNFGRPILPRGERFVLGRGGWRY